MTNDDNPLLGHCNNCGKAVYTRDEYLRGQLKIWCASCPVGSGPDDEGIKEMVEELSRVLYITLHANGFDFYNMAEALVDNGWRKVMVTHET